MSIWKQARARAFEALKVAGVAGLVMAAPGTHAQEWTEEAAQSESLRRMLAAHCAPSGFAQKYLELSQRSIRAVRTGADAQQLELLASRLPAWTAAQVANIAPDDCADHLAQLIRLMQEREQALNRPSHYARNEGPTSAETLAR